MRTEIGSNAEQQAAPPGGEGYINKHECARRLGRTVRSVDTYMEKGILPFYKLGRTVAFKWSEVRLNVRVHIARCPPAISGQRGHDATYHVAAILVWGFALSEAEALMLLQEWNRN